MRKLPIIYYGGFIKVCYLEGMRLPLKKVACAHSFDDFSETLTISIHLVGELNYSQKLGVNYLVKK